MIIRSIASILFTLLSLSAEPLRLTSELWKSEAFRKSFNGSYRINARIEPTVDGDERKLLIDVSDLMAAGNP